MLETPAKQQIPHGTKTEGENFVDRDNQQVTCLNEMEKAWLAGFLDADGMIRLHKGQKNANPNQRSLVPKMSFFNTCGFTVKTISSLLDKAGIKNRNDIKRKTEKWKTGVSVVVMGIKQVKPLLEMLEPYMVTKRIEAQIVIEFCFRRLEPQFRQKGYCERDYLAFEALKFLKQTRHLRDYTPSVEDILGQDIVRTNAKALEVAETSTRLGEQARADWAKNLVSNFRWHKKVVTCS